MKRLFLYIVTLLLFASCAESVYDGSRTPSLNRRYLYVPTSTLSFSAVSPASNKVLIESDQTDWTISIPAPWVKASPTSGNTSMSVEFSVEENASADTSRVCVVTVASDVSDWTRSFPISITQGTRSPYIKLTESSLVCDAKEQSLSFTVDANTDFTIDNTSESWVHVESYSSNSVNLSVDENNTDDERIATLVLKSKAHKATSAFISIRQKKAHITSTAEALQFGHSAVSETVVIESGASWEATATSWISVTPKTGKAGQTEVTISVPNNASEKGRNGSVYFSIAPNNIFEIPIEQEGVFLTLVPNLLSFDSFGGSKSLSILSNDTWMVTSKPEWVSLDMNEGTENGKIVVSVGENNTTSTLRGSIVIETADQVVHREISVVQQPKKINFDAPTVNFPYTAGTKSFSFLTDGKWTASSNSDWFTIDKTSGSGDATITIHVDENMSLTEREGVINVIIADQSFDVYVHQECKYLNLSSSAFTFEAEKGTAVVNLSSGLQWSAEVSEGSDWISVSPKSGLKDANITICVAENNTASKRRGKVVVTIPGVHAYAIKVTQNHKYIKTDMTSIDFTQVGGQIIFNVRTNGTFEVSKIGSWFGYIRNGDVITIVAPENTTGSERTGALLLKLTNIEGGSYSVMIPVKQDTKTSVE